MLAKSSMSLHLLGSDLFLRGKEHVLLSATMTTGNWLASKLSSKVWLLLVEACKAQKGAGDVLPSSCSCSSSPARLAGSLSVVLALVIVSATSVDRS